MALGKLGVWTAIDSFPAAQAAAFARRIEGWGYGALWIPEAVGREVFSAAAWLLASTGELTLASGIANIYARDAVSTAVAQKGLNEQSGGRFLLGLGVSHGGKLLCVEQGAILETDAHEARARGRRFLSLYLALPNYVNNWRRLGFSDADFAGGGSDRLIDAVIAWGDEKAIRSRLEAHWLAGADHVCVQAIGAAGAADERLLQLLAPRQ